ncbi:MAG TPA: FAD-binding oxidoreductase [Clostridiales bacterium]|nr:FAD-binding oxidoreductase [Clostridiales bacterium]HQP70534.1 FAD-binding oxidoreductase [Clostridiales bacterium]
MLSSQNKNKLIAILEHKNYETAGDSLIIFPEDINYVGTLIKTAKRFGMKIIPIGGGSTFEQNYNPLPNSFFLSTQKLNSITDLDKNNMFIELQSGCNWKNVFTELSGQGLYFPIDINTISEKRTAGGIFSSLKPDSKASNYFTGLEFIAPDGSIMRYGCKTLKNVSGYDLVKFMSGSCGKFGIITSLILRLFSSEKNFFIFEDIGSISVNRNELKEDPVYLRLKAELDPNEIFVS